MTEEPTAAPEAGGEPADKTFTQTQVNQLIQDRLAREQKKYEGFDELRSKAEQFDQLQDQQKSEIQKAQERATKAEQAAAQRTQAANERLLEAAVLAQATSQKAIRPEHLFKLIDRDKVTVGDDGQVTGVEEAVKAFLQANPEYVGSTRPRGFADQGARTSVAPTVASFDDVIRGRAGR